MSANMNVEKQPTDHVRIGSIVMRCCEFDRMLQFWQAALNYEIHHRDRDFVILRDPAGKGPNISLDKVATKRTGKRGWLHLDLYTADQTSEVARLTQLGAAQYPWRYEPHADYVVLADPDGNLFCVVQI